MRARTAIILILGGALIIAVGVLTNPGNVRLAQKSTISPSNGLDVFRSDADRRADTVRNNLQRLRSGADSFIRKYGRPPASLEELVGPDKVVKSLIPVVGVSYDGLDFEQHAPLSATLANGDRITYDGVRMRLFDRSSGGLISETSEFLNLDERERSELVRLRTETLARLASLFDSASRVTAETNGILIEYDLKESDVQSVLDELDSSIQEVLDEDSSSRYVRLENYPLASLVGFPTYAFRRTDRMSDVEVFVGSISGVPIQTPVRVNVLWTPGNPDAGYLVTLTAAGVRMAKYSADEVLDDFFGKAVAKYYPQILNERQL